MEAPAADEVELWVASLDVGPQMLAHAGSALSERERERFARVIRPVQRDRLTVARAALRTVLATYLQTRPADVRIERGPGGKPLLADGPGLAFNMSHSGGLAAIAVTCRPAVGIDIEILGREVRPGVIARALAPAELAFVQAVAEERRGEAFLRHWTAKEAYGKALGAGLAVGMARVVIRDALTEPLLADPALVHARGGDWSLQRFDPARGAVGAVVADGGPWQAHPRGSVALARGRRAGVSDVPRDMHEERH